jgi:hypothetical protein
MKAGEFYDLVDGMTHAAWARIPDAAVADMALADKCEEIMERINDAMAEIMADVFPAEEDAREIG